jgi:pyrroline-5-carboxylate reductase
MDSVIAFIGCGNMGSSLIGGLIADGVPPERLRGADADPAQCARVRERYGISAGTDNVAAASGAQVVVLAVKPQVARATIAGIAPVLGRERPVLLSIAAGIRLESLRAWIGADLPMVRAMPNTPALIRAGAAALYAGPGTSEEHRERAESILRAVGAVVWLEDEDLLDAVTALSGSGPAYFFRMMEALEDGAVALGLPRESARLLTLETALGAARMALESRLEPAALRRQVTSPGGTTESALKALDNGGFAPLLGEALAAARDRSRELAETLKEE